MTQDVTVHEAGSGPPLLFLHGWTMDGGIFEGQFARLSNHFHCLAPDLPGHASAQHLPATLDNTVAETHRLIEERGLNRLTLIGWSMGAATAWRYISRHGTGRLAHLVTIDMSPRIINGADWQLGLIGQTPETIAASTAFFRADWPASARLIASGAFADRHGPPNFNADMMAAKIARADPDAMNIMWDSLAAMDERATIPGITIPYLVAHGGQSRAYPAACADWLADQAPRAREHCFTQSGHSPHLEEPDAFAQAIAEFARGQ